MTLRWWFLEASVSLETRQTCSKHCGYAKPCPYRTGLKTWLEVLEMLHTILLLERVTRVVAEESSLKVEENQNQTLIAIRTRAGCV